MPCGYSARFRRLEGPLEKLAVHTWRQIEERYRRYDFAGVLQLLEEALPEVTIPKASGAENLRLFLQVCQNWEAGQLWAAHQNSEKLTTVMPQAIDLIPTVVNTIWRYWPNPNDPKAELATDFFLDPGAILLYGEDELRRAKRLCENGRYRSAFTRSFALIETLLKTRAALLHEKRQYLCEKVIQRGENQRGETHEQQSDIVIDLYSSDYEELYRNWLSWLIKLSAYDLSQLLRQPKTGKLHKTGSQKWNGCKYRVWWGYQGEPKYLDDQLYLYSATNKEIPDIRNLVVHSYYPINDPQVVEKCLTLAQKSLADFKGNWVSQAQVENTLKKAQFEPPGWEAIKSSFNLSLPEQNQPLQAEGG